MTSFPHIDRKTGATQPPPEATSRLPWDQQGYLTLRQLRDLLLAPVVIPLAWIGLSPSLLSLAGVGLAIGTCLILPERPFWAGVVFLGALVCDAADGALARRLGRSSQAGKLIDQLCDSATVTAMLAAFLLVGIASPLRTAFAIYLTVVLLFLAMAYNTRAHPTGWVLNPRAGFWAQTPRSLIYGSFVLYLFGGVDIVDPTILVSNVAATIFATVYVYRLARTISPRSKQTGC